MLKKLNLFILTLVAVGSFAETSFAKGRADILKRIIDSVRRSINHEEVESVTALMEREFEIKNGLPLLRYEYENQKQAARIYRGLKTREEKQKFVRDLEGVVKEAISERLRLPQHLSQIIKNSTERVLNKWEGKTHGTTRTYAQAKPKGRGKGSR